MLSRYFPRFAAVWLALALETVLAGSSGISTYTNPVLPGWHSDPSCVFIPEWDDTFFCATSSFLAFPGLPIYASKDLVNWRLVSHAVTRPAQIPEALVPGHGQQDGPYAPTLRFHEGLLYVTASIFNTVSGPWPIVQIAIYTTPDPYDSSAWSEGVVMKDHVGLDPDIFWDDNGQAYLSYAAFGIMVAPVNMADGTGGSPVNIWNGTGGRNAEAPHIYHKDGLYYLLIAEGGTEMHHAATIARSQSITGPYESYFKNPILTNNNTDEYFQTVGHADFFQDSVGSWWGLALATRSGPEWEIYPMGRESVLFPLKWEQGEWPVLEQVRGRMSGPLPPRNRNVPGSGPFVDDEEDVRFSSGVIPPNFVTWRPQDPTLFHPSPPESPQALRIAPSRANLTGDDTFDPAKEGLAFISRRQTSTLFEYSIDISFLPTVQGEEAGISVFLTQKQHIDLSIIHLPSSSTGKLVPHFRFRVELSGKPGTAIPETKVVSIPRDWLCRPIRLIVSTPDDKTFIFSASSVNKPGFMKELGRASGEVVSGGSGPFTGTLIGAYATNNGGKGTTPAYVTRWRYKPVAQKVGKGDMVYIKAGK